MKINISIEATPEEIRETLGMPNLSKVQGEVLEKFAEQMRTGQMDSETMEEMMGPTFQFGRQFVETLGRSMETMMKSATDAQVSEASKS
jgi:hypothetical protein